MSRTLARIVTAALFTLTTVSVVDAREPANRVGRLKLAEVEIHYEVLGAATGTPLVVVNGGPGFDHGYLLSSDAWRTLATRRPVVVYDQRGTGRSSPFTSREQCRLVDQIQDLDALVKELGGKADLLGHSWGGYLAMAYTARNPSRVRRLIVADSAAPKWGDTLFMFDQFYPDITAAQEARAFGEALGDARDTSHREYFSMLFVSPEKRDAFIAAAKAFSYSSPVNGALNADLKQFDLGPELAKLELPALVITGRFDVNVAPLTAWRIHGKIRGSRIVVFERSGHLPFLEEPERFVQVVNEFLEAR